MIFSGKLVPGKIGRFDEETHFPDNWTAVQFEFLYFVWNTDDDSGNSHPPHSSLTLSLSLRNWRQPSWSHSLARILHKGPTL